MSDTQSAAPAQAAPTETNQPENSANQLENSTKPLTQAQKERVKLKVDGQEIEEEIDWNDKESRIKDRQLSLAAKKRMQEASDVKKKASEIISSFESEEKFLEMLKKHPKGRNLAEKLLLEQIQDEMLSPEEKDQRELRAKLAKYEAKEKEELTKAEQAQLAQKEAKYVEQFQTEIIDAVKKTELPVTPDVIRRMAALKSRALDLGLDLDASDLAEEYKKEELAKFQAMVKSADGAQLIKMFGEDMAKKIRQYDLQGLMQKQSQVFQKPAKTAQPVNTKEDGRPLSMEEWKEQLNKRFGS